MMERSFAGRTFVLRIDRSPIEERTTLWDDLGFLMQRGVRPIVVGPSVDLARAYVRRLNRNTNIAVGLSGADAALLPAGPSDAVGRVQPAILATLTEAGYIPVIEPTALGLGGRDVEICADDVASAIAAATDAARAIFFHAAGGVFDPQSQALVAELTPAEALALTEEGLLDPELSAAVRAAALGVRAGVGAAQIFDGRIAHAAIVEFLTEYHLGTQVTGSVFRATA
jgi:acetylglutamate kinase